MTLVRPFFSRLSGLISKIKALFVFLVNSRQFFCCYII
ncbi:hypothetical protein DCCM_2841 [Desulfocucumis palustris]|uniref:Uncharacterized protein n=1 Tax=Desulfocucumis palustris TaxID=1898651 RepID=A0A2L2XIK0_9FIRM|nr:hypothetical protein DCCM_2841 [Desulfocucumis palustris]